MADRVEFVTATWRVRRYLIMSRSAATSSLVTRSHSEGHWWVVEGKGEGSIYQRDDGVWIGAIDLGWSGARDRERSLVPRRVESRQTPRELHPSVAQV